VDLNAALAYAAGDFEKTLEDLKALIRIPSISFAGFDPAPPRQAAAACLGLLAQAGLQTRERAHPGAPPYILGFSKRRPDRPTVLFYAHYDVQPPMRAERWKSPAFAPEVRDGRLYGRGSADDKAGVMLAVAAAGAWLKSGQELPVNLIVVLDGEEEIGSPHFADFLRANQADLAADVLVVADLDHYETGIPSLTTSLRGILVAEVELRSLDKPLHSGMWGGAIPDPIAALCRVIASLTDERGRLSVPGIHEGVIPPSEAELQGLKSLHHDVAVFRKNATVRPGVALLEEGDRVLLRTWREPSLVVNAIESGSRKQGGNVLMDAAWARLGVRVAPGQDPARVRDLLVEAIKARVPWGLEVSIACDHVAPPWKTDTAHPAFAAMKRAMRDAYGREALEVGSGATIPFVPDTVRALGGIPALLIPVEDPSTNAHGENESLHLGDFRKALQAQVRFFAELASSHVRV